MNVPAILPVTTYLLPATTEDIVEYSDWKLQVLMVTGEAPTGATADPKEDPLVHCAFTVAIFSTLNPRISRHANIL